MSGRPGRRGWGHVRRLPSGHWQASYPADGARTYAPMTFSTRRTAERWLEAERHNLERLVAHEHLR